MFIISLSFGTQSNYDYVISFYFIFKKKLLYLIAEKLAFLKRQLKHYDQYMKTLADSKITICHVHEKANCELSATTNLPVFTIRYMKILLVNQIIQNVI